MRRAVPLLVIAALALAGCGQSPAWAPRWLGDVLFWGGVNLVAMAIVAPRALSRKLSPAEAFRAGLLGVWLVGVLIAMAIGVVMDIKQHSSGLATIGLTILSLPFCFLAGLIAGVVFRTVARIRAKREGVA